MDENKTTICICPLADTNLLSGRAARLQTAPACAFTDCSLLDAPTSNTSRFPSLVPTTACLLPGANKAHRPYPASIVRKQTPDLGFQILTSLFEPDKRRESSLDRATVLMSERWPGDSRSCRRLTSSSLMCQTCKEGLCSIPEYYGCMGCHEFYRYYIVHIEEWQTQGSHTQAQNTCGTRCRLVLELFL